MIHLHLLCFQSMAVWEERAKSFTRVGNYFHLKEENFRSQFQVFGFEQKFAFDC